MRLIDWLIEKKLFEPEYIIREIEPQLFEVSKWTKGSGPAAVYRVEYTTRHGKKYWRCSCPVKGSRCKHIKMVKEWIKKGKKPLIPVSNIDVGKIKYRKRLGENINNLSDKEKESLYKLLRYHGTREDVTSKASWGTHCKNRFKKLTGMTYSEEAAKKAWNII